MNIRRALARLAVPLAASGPWAGSLLLVGFAGIAVSCSSGSNTPALTITAQPAAQTVVDGHTATFTVTATGQNPVTYQWQRNGQAISGATSASYTTAATVYANDNHAQFTVVVSDAGNRSVTSEAAILTVTPIAPTVTPLTDQTVAEGAQATFNATGSGTAPITYKWQRAGQDLAGATQSSYTTPAVTYAADNNVQYTVVVTNGAGQTTTSSAKLLVSATATLITSAPQSTAVVDGQGVTFSVTATGSTPLSYQWKKNNQIINGATSSSYTLPAAVYASDNGALFTVDVTNAAQQTVTSAAATLTVTPIAPVIGTSPQSVTVTDGQPANFSVAATGTAPLSYQWYRGATAVTGGTGATLTLPATAWAQDNNATYHVVVTNGANQTVTSGDATLTVTPVRAALTGPANVTATDGQTATFSVSATGTAPFTYQWKRGGAVIGSATSASYTTAALVYANDNNAQFSVDVTNGAGQVTSSNAATLTVTPLTTTVSVPDATVTDGQTATFTATVAGTGPFTYQWKRGGTVIPGANAISYTTAVTVYASDNSAKYTLDVTNGAGTTTASSPATLIVTPLPTQISGPADATVNEGATATFTVTATGTGPFTYQWKRNGTTLTGATAASYTTAALLYADNNAVYSVTVTNAAGVASNASATLTVNPTAPVITVPPAAQSTVQGTPVTFTVTATGSAPLSYQWYENGLPVTGATATSWTLANPAVAADNGAEITVKVTNGAGQSVTSSPVILTVTAAAGAPQITTDLASSYTVTVPDGQTFTVAATGTNLTYTWKKNGSVVGSNSPTYTVATTDLSGSLADTYQVTVSNTAGSVDSTAATLTIKAPVPVYAGDPVVTPNGFMTGHIYQVLSSFKTDAPADPLGSFRVGYDSTQFNPAWAATCFFPIINPISNKRPGSYPTDTRIVGATPVTENDFGGSGYSRGHQVGYADLAYRFGQTGGDSTMYMTNMCPQVQTFNGGVWEQLAGLLNSYTPSDTSFTNLFGRVWVYTGPIFADTIDAPFQTKAIQVPSAFYNVVVRETSPGNPKGLAIIMPHSTIINNGTTSYTNNSVTLNDCWKYVTTIDRVQKLTGLTFFPSPASPLPAGFTTTVDVRGWGTVLENGINKPNVHMIQPSWDSTYVLGKTTTPINIKVTSGTQGTPMAFEAQSTPANGATGTAATIASTVWNFGDGQTANQATTTHTFATAGDFVVTFTATDGSGASNSISRVVTIASSAPTGPTVSGLADVTTTPTGSRTLTFTVSDAVSLPGNITVTVKSGDTTILVDNPTVANASGTCTVTLVPTGTLGATTYTVTAKNEAGLTTVKTFNFTVSNAGPSTLTENFDNATKTSYAAADVTLASGTWTLTDTYLGNTAGSDRFNGLKCARTRNQVSSTQSRITMKFDFLAGAKTVTVYHASYGTDSAATWALYYSTDGGNNWTKAGDDVTTNSTTLTPATFTINVQSPIRFDIRRTDAVVTTSYPRICFDDFSIAGY